MSAFPVPPPQPHTRRRQHRRSIISNSSMSDDEDAITPAPIATIQAGDKHAETAREPLPAPPSVRQHPPAPAHQEDGWREHAPHLDTIDGGDADTEQLWRRMLALQRVFGCYNSARMSAALSAEDDDEVGRLRPSRTCLDLLNDSILQLPDEEKHQLEMYLFGSTKRKGASRRKVVTHGPE